MKDVIFATQFIFDASSKAGGRVAGAFALNAGFRNRDYITYAVLERCAKQAVESDQPWDPFNVTLNIYIAPPNAAPLFK